MTIPPIAGVGGLGSGGLSLQASEGALAEGASPTAAEGALAQAPAGAAPEGAAGVEGAGSSGGFGSELTQAISSLEGSQRSADSAAQALATGTVKDPESAVVTVEDAAMGMQLAAQLRTKATEAAQTIFQTQA
ncbi:MAG TPA: flagellar hook-basal body complex protein FliE [Solirubrobacteraceae bacterium]|nr:flagellar hook-basal body complex protein FliE [Solirubrobacteraceae bacterium]